MANNSFLSQIVFDGRALLFCSLRAAVLDQLYPTKSTAPILGKKRKGIQERTNQILNDLTSSFSRFAGNQQTAFDNGASRSSAGSTGSMLEKQVERAFTQVLGRSPGYSSDSFMNALTGTFPATTDGRQVSFTPTRSVISLYSANGSSYGSGSYGLNAYSNGSSSFVVGQLSTKQATLYRQASLVAGDALKVLAGLTSFLPEADVEEVEALRSLIQSEISTLIDEFGRVDEPRDTRVEDYLNALKVNVTEFGRRALLDNPRKVTTVNDEAQVAGFFLLKEYAAILRTVWDNYNTSERPITSFSLSEQVERANVVLPIIGQSNVDFEDALDSVGFGESEQRSRAARFNTLKIKSFPSSYLNNQRLTGSSKVVVVTPPAKAINPNSGIPDITVRDLAEWLDRFANIEGPSMLTDSGQFGLNFVTDQADSLFWTLVPIIAVLQTTESVNPTGGLMLRQVLSNERVRWALDNILEQLNVLANLACDDADAA
jgi:hypothetical protein